MNVVFFSFEGLALDQAVHLKLQSMGASYATLLFHNMSAALCQKQAQLLQYGVTLFQNNATPHYHHIVQALLQDWEWEILKHPPYSLDLVP